VATGDAEIRGQLLVDFGRQASWNSSLSNVLVSDGVVLSNDLVENEIRRRASHVAAENVPGVRAVQSERVLIFGLPAMF
jgi:osmotically-inducible protein OsmY